MAGILLETVFSGVVLLALTVPPGLLFLRMAGFLEQPLARLAIAIGVGLVLVLVALVAELSVGGPWFVLPMSALALWRLKPGRSILVRVRAMAPELMFAVALGGLALVANGGDVARDASGLSVRVGFDVSDRAFYGTVAQELERAPIWRVENPGFAPLPLQYSYLHALTGVLVHRYAGTDPLWAFGLGLPAFGLFWTGLATAALAETLGAKRLLARLLPAALMVSGGDFSLLVPQINESWLERTRHFFVFYSFSSEALFYNPWMFGLPMLLTTLLGLSGLRNGPPSVAAPASILLAGLFQAKVFAFIPLWLAVGVLGVVRRDHRLWVVTAGSLLLVAPGAWLVAASGAAREGLPLAFAPFSFVHEAIAGNPSLESLRTTFGFWGAALVVLVGGFGLRLLGLRRLVSELRASPKDTARVAALAMTLGLALALIFVGRPTRIDGVQFLLLPQALLWLFAGLTLSGWLFRPGPLRFVALALLPLALASPMRYFAFKAAPARLVSEEAIERRRFRLSPQTLEACAWLRGFSEPTDRLVMPLVGDPEDRGGLKPLYAGLLASRRLVAQANAASVSAPLARERQRAVVRLYETTDAAEGEALLRQLEADWVWEDAARPLRFRSAQLTPRAQFAGTRLLQVERTP